MKEARFHVNALAFIKEKRAKVSLVELDRCKMLVRVHIQIHSIRLIRKLEVHVRVTFYPN